MWIKHVLVCIERMIILECIISSETCLINDVLGVMVVTPDKFHVPRDNQI